MSDIPDCPKCGNSLAVRQKLLLVDKPWEQKDNEIDPRTKYFTALRVDALRPEVRKHGSIEQFVDGWFCEACGSGFVPDEYLIDKTYPYGPVKPKTIKL